ncbi:VanZ family protein [Lachnospiraceae bacterium ZAX-1]
MGKNKWLWKIGTALPIFVLLCFIFSFSEQTGEESAGLSGKIAYYIAQGESKLFLKKWSVEQVEDRAQSLQFPVRKAAHMSEYALLSILFCIHLCAYDLTKKKVGAMALCFTIVCATGDEIHQLFVPGRSGQPLDVLIDSVGAFAGMGLFCFLSRSRKRT